MRELKWTVVVIPAIFVGLQFNTREHTNPPFDETKTLERMIGVPAEVSAAFARSCNDYHTNNTNWRWYTYVAPVSWFTVGHVYDGRKELNFSEWGSYGERLKHTRLNAICAQVEKGTMPLPSYAFVHPEVKLSQDEVKTICDWAKTTRDSVAMGCADRWRMSPYLHHLHLSSVDS